MNTNYYYIESPFECCRYCSNNPRNNPNASGVCHCTLPSLEGSQPVGDYYYTTTTDDSHNMEIMLNPLVRHRRTTGMDVLKESWLYR